jgi:protein SCO1/2
LSGGHHNTHASPAEDKSISHIPIQPLFISVDPNRDSPEAIAKYLEEFDSKMVGLTGDYESIKKMCKVYRVYFSTPPNVKPGEDYLVDHSMSVSLFHHSSEYT